MKASVLPLGLLVARIGRSVRQIVAAQVEPLGLSIQEFWTLIAIAEHPITSQAELATRQHVDEATICRVVRTLTERELLAGVRDPQDRRRVRLALTPQGAALVRRLVPVARGVRHALEAALEPTELEATCLALGKVVARVEGLIEAAPPAVPLAPGRAALRPRRSPSSTSSAARARAAGRSRSPAPRGSP